MNEAEEYLFTTVDLRDELYNQWNQGLFTTVDLRL
jgi:hypothetical protein